MSNRIGRPPNVTEAEIENWVRLYNSGMSPVEIAANDPNGRVYSTIYNYIHDRVKLRKSGRKPEVTPQQVSQWKRLRKEGKTYTQIAMRTNFSVQTVTRHTKKAERLA